MATKTNTNSELERRILELCEKYKEGINNDMIMNNIPNVQNEALLDVMNVLLKKSKLQLFKKPGYDKSPFYKLKDPAQHYKLKGADNEEKMIYEIIARSENSGIWVRKIKNESQLHLNTIEKVLKRLESKKMIKSVVSVQKPKHKHYLLASIEPDRKITGGPFYSDNQFDSSFVNALMDAIFKYMENKQKKAENDPMHDNPLEVVNAAKVTSKEIQEFIDRVKLTKTKLNTEDIEKLLTALEYDGKIESTLSRGFSDDSVSVRLWRAVPDWAPIPTILRTPCGVCPKIDQCSDIGEINPQTCRYLEEWLA